MFQKLNYFAALFIVLFTLQSCQKDAIIPVSPITVEATETTDNSAEFAVSVENGVLNFPTRVDYEKAIEYLADKDDQALANWNSELNFTSLETFYTVNEIGEKKQEVGDEVFASLLNEDKMIKINGNTIMVDLNEEAVYVLTNGETAPIKDLYNRNIDNPAIKVFSTDVDVLDILDGDDSSLFQKASYCDSENTGWNSAGYCNPKTLEWRMRYFKAGLYYSLTAKYQGNATGCWNKIVNLLDGFATNKKKTINFSKDSDESISSTATVRPYSSTRSLKDYSMNCDFHLEDVDDGYTQFVDEETISCTK